MKKNELFKQAYTLEKERGYICLSREGKILWANEPASQMLPMLIEGQSAAVVFPGFDAGCLGDTCLLPLTGGLCARVSRFEESDPDEIFYIAEITAESVSVGNMSDYMALLAMQMREKIGRIRSLVSESRSGLSDIQADYSGNVPRLAAELDRQITWISGAEKDCDALMRCVLQAEESIAPDGREDGEQMDISRFLPLLIRDIDLLMKEDSIPLELTCDWNAADCGNLIGCSRERFALAFLGMVRIAAVSALLCGSNQLFLQVWNDDGMFAIRLRDRETDPAQLEAYESLPLCSGHQLPTPANFAARRLRRLMESVEGSWMLGRTPGDAGYTVQLRFPLLRELPPTFECSSAYDFNAGEPAPGESGLQEMIRLMLSSLEDDMR
ncbi:MAG: hypothetical protein IJD13_09155 [Oscillospiraceae bacterium]|nr:hypothetical protein [Oscillospiraceae bacterium]